MLLKTTRETAGNSSSASGAVRRAGRVSLASTSSMLNTRYFGYLNRPFPNRRSIDVVVGAPAEPPESIVRSYLDGKLQPGENICEH